MYAYIYIYIYINVGLEISHRRPSRILLRGPRHKGPEAPDSYLSVVKFSQTKGGTRISRPGDAYSVLSHTFNLQKSARGPKSRAAAHLSPNILPSKRAQKWATPLERRGNSPGKLTTG